MMAERKGILDRARAMFGDEGAERRVWLQDTIREMRAEQQRMQRLIAQLQSEAHDAYSAGWENSARALEDGIADLDHSIRICESELREDMRSDDRPVEAKGSAHELYR